MNPFKYKQLEEFTIADCELYINRYPYGEHIIDVQEHLRNLAKAHQNESKETNNLTETKKVSQLKTELKRNLENGESTINKIKTSDDVIKTIFAWIGIIVVVLVVGTIIITILNEILPYNWWNKYRYIIYPAGLALGRWLQKEFNW